ncbi:unnamed protein product [Callosobruchus maculatus]|uniref:Uncharacterized protein n=1 Tax=Callosobruchus maculatus TaxID=64391 RepID=A0A653C7Y8_CALMS|nr:unnamed protein product [Callosobruchus maculatus]
MNQRHFGSFNSHVTVTPYFSKLCHGDTCLLNALYLNCRSKNRGTQNFELPHNGLLTLFLDDYRVLYPRS